MSVDESQAMFKIESSDKQVFDISVSGLKQSATLKNIYETASDVIQTEAMPVEGVLGDHLKLIVKWCEHHKGEAVPTEFESIPKNVEIPEWDKKFFQEMSDEELFGLINATNFLDIKRLLNYSCRFVSNMAKGLSAEEMRVRFGINSDEEDEAQGIFVPKENTQQ